MGLVPTYFTEDVYTDFGTPSDYCQGLAEYRVRVGWYRNPADGEDTMIERHCTQVSHSGRVLRHEEENWEYDAPGTPHRTRKKSTWGELYLPEINPGRGYILLDEEVETVHPWSDLMPGPNLHRVVQRTGRVIYTLAAQRTEESADAQTKREERDQEDGDDPRLVLQSAQAWSEAITGQGIIEESDEPQTTKWLLYETLTEWVFEEIDKYTITGTIQSHIRPDDVRNYGPEYQRKELFQYRLPVPMIPPVVDAARVGDAIRIEIEGGGANVWGRFIRPEKYRLLRRVIEGDERDLEVDPFDLWDTDPVEAPEPRRIWSNLAVAGLDGTPTSPVPSQTSYTEPGDTGEPPVVAWTVIAEPEVERGLYLAPPQAVVEDDDVVAGSTYEYAAQAIIGQDESELSNIDSVTYNGNTNASSIKVRVKRDPVELDIVSAEGTDLTEDYGDVVEFTVPALIPVGEEEALGEDIGSRQFAKYRDPVTTVSADVLIPLLIVERGQVYVTPDVGWKTIGNDLQIDSEITGYEWRLEGFRLSAERQGDAVVGAERTRLYFVEP